MNVSKGNEDALKECVARARVVGPFQLSHGASVVVHKMSATPKEIEEEIARKREEAEKALDDALKWKMQSECDVPLGSDRSMKWVSGFLQSESGRAAASLDVNDEEGIARKEVMDIIWTAFLRWIVEKRNEEASHTSIEKLNIKLQSVRDGVHLSRFGVIGVQCFDSASLFPALREYYRLDMFDKREKCIIEYDPVEEDEKSEEAEALASIYSESFQIPSEEEWVIHVCHPSISESFVKKMIGTSLFSCDFFLSVCFVLFCLFCGNDRQDGFGRSHWWNI
jgi:hypothetical protein